MKSRRGYGIQLLTVIFLLSEKHEVFAQGPTVEVQAVIKGVANLPCSVRPPVKNDSATLVVWYRNEMDAIYSYDTRGKLSEIGSHWKNNTVIGERAFFRTLPEPAMLIIEDVKQSDEGPYRCRVDFQKSPTKNHKIWLRVIVPPEKPLIYDQRGFKVGSVAGPYEENADVRFTCRVHNGHPAPKVRWWKGESLLESNNVVNAEGAFVESELVIRKISRSHLKAVYTCQASNNNISTPQATSVTLDLYLSSLSVNILSSRQPLSADRKYDVVCQAVGSRPPAKITWWKNNERLTDFVDTISADENITTSTLAFTPVVEDHNKTLICRAINLKIKTAIDEDRWILDITFLPVPTLEFGSQLLNPNDIEEGDDVYFQCKVYANPRAYKVVWKHNGYVVQNDPKSGVIADYETLVLRSVNRKQSGNYTCFASNVEGDSESNALELHIMYKPICKSDQKVVYGLARNQNAQISCEVDAYPFADGFSWTFNNSDQTNIAEKHRKSENRRNFSILHINPVSEMDFGVLLCSAKNVVGEQSEPCVFRIIPAGRPDTPQNCVVINQTMDSLGVECVPGFDGGQSAMFSLEVFNEDSGMLVANSSRSTPSFFIDNLTPGTTLTMNLYAENGHGKSPSLIVEASTLNAAEKHTGVPSVINLTPYVVLLIGMTVFCSLSAIVIMGALRAHAFFGSDSQCFREARNSASIKKDLAVIEQTIKLEVNDDDDKNPDVIPSALDDDYEILQINHDKAKISKSYPKKGSNSATAENVWCVNNSTNRNGDVAKKPKHVILSKRIIPCDKKTDYPDATTNQRNVNGKLSEDAVFAPIKNSNVPTRMENASPGNIIRVPSQKEIVTVRTPLMSSQQESCV